MYYEHYDDFSQYFFSLIEKIPLSRQKLIEESTTLPLSDALFCAEDIIRNKRFRDAIALFLSQKKTDTLSVADLGAWTWLLGCMALSLWAKHCVFIESHKPTYDFLCQLLEQSWRTSRSECLFTDATSCDLSAYWSFDLLLSETIAADLTEDYISIVNHTQQFLSTDGIFIPQKIYLSSGETSWEGDTKTLPMKEPLFKTWQTVSWVLTLYQDITITSWECLSLMNTRVIE